MWSETSTPAVVLRVLSDSPLNPQHSTLNTRPSTLNTQHSTLNTQTSTLKPSILNPEAQTLNSKRTLFSQTTKIRFMLDDDAFEQAVD